MSLSGGKPSKVQLHREIENLSLEQTSSTTTTTGISASGTTTSTSSVHRVVKTTAVTTVPSASSRPGGISSSLTSTPSVPSSPKAGVASPPTVATSPAPSSKSGTGLTVTVSRPGSGSRPRVARNEKEDEILTASPTPSQSPSATPHGRKTNSDRDCEIGSGNGGIGREGIAGDIGQIEDVTSIQPGSSVTRVYKKCASNGSLAVYVGTRTLTLGGNHLEPLKGVLVLDHDSLIQNISSDFRIWGQITLTFRYGREDEEVLGLRFCNEAILALKQLWPPMQRDPEDPDDEDEELTPLQTVLLERIQSSATTESIKSVPFVLCGGPVGLGSFPPPPSVLLAPAKPYRGSPIGTIYDLRIYASERPEERPPRRNLIRLALRAVQMPCINVPFELKGSLEARPTILSRGKIRFHCELNKNAVRYGEPLEIKVVVQNNSRSSIRRVLVSLIQQVDVCMFTSGKFKNTVGCADDTVLIVPGASLQKRYELTPTRGPARQWLALEEAFGRDPVLAPSTIIDKLFDPKTDVPSPPPTAGSANARNVFAIIVSYYVKVKLVLGGLSLGQCVKVPFVLLPPENAEPDPYPDPNGTGVQSSAATSAAPPPSSSSSQVAGESSTSSAFPTTTQSPNIQSSITAATASKSNTKVLAIDTVTASLSSGRVTTGVTAGAGTGTGAGAGPVAQENEKEQLLPAQYKSVTVSTAIEIPYLSNPTTTMSSDNSQEPVTRMMSVARTTTTTASLGFHGGGDGGGKSDNS